MDPIQGAVLKLFLSGAVFRPFLTILNGRNPTFEFSSQTLSRPSGPLTGQLARRLDARQCEALKVAADSDRTAGNSDQRRCAAHFIPVIMKRITSGS